MVKYTLVRKPGLKHIYLQVKKNLEIEVRTNEYVSLEVINKFIDKKTKWINLRIAQLKHYQQKKIIENENFIFYLGEKYQLICSSNIKFNNHVELKADKMLIQVFKKNNDVSTEFLIDQFYKSEINIISSLTDKWSKIMGLFPNKISFRKARTRWGSCNAENNISYSIFLLKLPIFLIEYIVVHELSHIKHKNHSRQFWDLVTQYLPDYTIRQNKIREFEKNLLL